MRRMMAVGEYRWVTLPWPIGTQPHYGEHLGDAGYWAPYVMEVVRREMLAEAPVEAPFVGTFPTFLVGDAVIKLFGSAFDGGESWAAELAMHELLAAHPDIPAPMLVASGQLFDDAGEAGWTWPYLVTTRLHGFAVRDRPLRGAAGARVAEQAGEAVARLHGLVPPAEVNDRHVVNRLRAEAPSRLAGFGLPARLVEQVPSFLADAPEPGVLVHADITADHLFVAGRRLSGILDWGDAIVADRYYELVPLAFDCFAVKRGLLAAFLGGYGWPVDADFPRQAMQAVCEFQFDAISTIANVVALARVDSLDALAEVLFGWTAMGQ